MLKQTRHNQQSVAKKRSEIFTEKDDKEIITINYIETGSIIEGLVCGRRSKIFLDTGAKVNIISLQFLRKLKPGVVVLQNQVNMFYKV